MKLVNPDDGALNGVFAQEVAGWILHEAMLGYGIPPTTDSLVKISDFVESADLVLPWLNRHAWIARKCADGIHMTVDAAVSFEPTPFPRAAVISLLRAHGIEVEFT